MRRSGSALATFLERASDPGGAAGRLQLYTKDVDGAVQLFGQDSDSIVRQMTPPIGVLRDTVSLSAPQTTFSLGSAGDGNKQYAFEAKSYFVVFTCERGAAGIWLIELRLNGSSSFIRRAVDGNNIGAQYLDNNANMIMSGGSTINKVTGSFIFRAGDATRRPWWGQFGLFEGAGDDVNNFSFHAIWDTSDALTSIDWHNTLVDGYGAGTKVMLYELFE